MASANISFDQIPASIRKPGDYFEFNTKLAVRTLPGNQQRLVLIGQRLAAGTVQAATLTSVFSDQQAATFFGYGSQLHLMARAAIKANAYLQLDAVALDDAAGSTAATGSLALAGTATSAGSFQFKIANSDAITVGVSMGDTAAVVAAAINTALGNLADLPVTAAVAAGVVTLTARNKGTQGNQIAITVLQGVAGLVPTITAMAGGAADPVLTPALTAIFPARHNLVCSGLNDQVSLTALRTHLDAVGSPLEQRDALGVYGVTGSLGAATTLAGLINHAFTTCGYLRGTRSQPCELAAAYAAVIASEEDPARPLNTLSLVGIDVPDASLWLGRTEQENLLYNGVTPMEIGPGQHVQIVRAITTYVLNPQGVPDIAMLDITTPRTLFYMRKAYRERIALRFPREKLSQRTPPKVRSELLDVSYKSEELEFVENVDQWKDGLLVERDLQNPNGLCAKIPVDVVNGLHVFAGRLDLIL
ncbi:phage tail sheath subtilisin-like domain-containing protein [Ralstonia pseudosolanacearum]|uniref:phage tail sheath subtilisin-like domain-containing protein n=1 Tax=Ralstonia pseudosolanacearum TaxID=1310165 RepID=UPI0008D9D93E|nr:phage tail sheath subtilisin-like domain-containing protein [Ralstonia pseudosolanacearum]MCL1618335.1 phage tail sheath subtilisin-like domain-containing protein [Ralstonia pseudosolanacearum CaRs-Mep]